MTLCQAPAGLLGSPPFGLSPRFGKAPLLETHSPAQNFRYFQIRSTQGRIMTSPTRKRADRSRKRLTELERLGVVERAQRYLNHESPGDTGEPCVPITRNDCILIGRAIRDGWDVPEAKRLAIIQQVRAALHSDNERLALSAARLVIAMEAANHA